MIAAEEEFQRLVVQVLERFVRQNGGMADDAAMRRVANQLARLIAERGVPPPLGEGEIGAPGELDKQEVKQLAARVLTDDTMDELLADGVKQLVKACFYPEFHVCRDSYREQSSKGVCKRQVLERARGRISGAHCVDCPYWTDVSPARHAELLREGWCADPEELNENRAVFLPDDFRAVRRWVRAYARGVGSNG